MQVNPDRQCEQPGPLLLVSTKRKLTSASVAVSSVGHKLQKVLDPAIEVGAKLVDVFGTGVPAGLVEDSGQGFPGNPSLLRDLAHGDVPPLLEFALGNHLFELESNHDWLICTKGGIFAPGVDIVKFGLILDVNAPYMDHSFRKWTRS